MVNSFLKLIIFLLLLLPLAAQAGDNCTKSAETVYTDFYTAWRYAIPEPSSRARDAIYSTQDYGKVYWDVMKRSPYKADRTKGVFLELKDRVDYAYRMSWYQSWNDSRVWQWVQQGVRDFNYLAWCYSKGIQK